MYIFVYVVLVVSSLLLVIDKLLSLYSLHPPLVTATIIVYLHSLYPWSLLFCTSSVYISGHWSLLPLLYTYTVYSTGHCYCCCLPVSTLLLLLLLLHTFTVYSTCHCYCCDYKNAHCNNLHFYPVFDLN